MKITRPKMKITRSQLAPTPYSSWLALTVARARCLTFCHTTLGVHSAPTTLAVPHHGGADSGRPRPPALGLFAFGDRTLTHCSLRGFTFTVHASRLRYPSCLYDEDVRVGSDAPSLARLIRFRWRVWRWWRRRKRWHRWRRRARSRCCLRPLPDQMKEMHLWAKLD